MSEAIGPRAPPLPTQTAPHGVRFDFNQGCRVSLPAGDWRVRITDLDTENTLLDRRFAGGVVRSPRIYYQR